MSKIGDHRPSFILASASPRRRDLLKSAGLSYEIIPSDIAEDAIPGEKPVDYARRMALEKAQCVHQKTKSTNEIQMPILAADTVVVSEGKIIGKPNDRNHAKRMLSGLSAKEHLVISGICVHSAEQGFALSHVTTKVFFKELTSDEIDRYLCREEWQDKAGAYAIQSGAAYMVRKIEGSYTNVVGLPLFQTLELLKNTTSSPGSTLGFRLNTVLEKAKAACLRVNRKPETVEVIGVSKRIDLSLVRQAYAQGARIFAENYVQAFCERREMLLDLNGLEWHFIGSLQRNKVKQIVGKVTLIHSIDRGALVREIQRVAEKKSLKQNVLVQVNISGEESKSGVLPEDLASLLDQFESCNNVRCVGLMTMPPFFEDPEQTRPYFRELKALLENHRKIPRSNVDLHHLSMGMSGDFEFAIEEGATLIRVGTAIFGPRQN